MLLWLFCHDHVWSPFFNLPYFSGAVCYRCNLCLVSNICHNYDHSVLVESGTWKTSYFNPRHAEEPNLQDKKKKATLLMGHLCLQIL